MEIKKIIDYINRGYIASDYLREPDVYYYMDMVIDDINERLQSRFPTFTEWKDFVFRWNNWVAGPDVLPPRPDDDDDDDNETHIIPPHPPVRPEKPVICRLESPGYGPHYTQVVPREFKPGSMPWLIKDNTKYDAFPDEYLRTVVALGVAVKFYTRDEEGEQIALDYQNRYEAALFKMVRDYHNQVPWYFQDNTGGFIDFSYNREEGPWDLVPRGVVLRGKDTKVL